VCAVAGRKLRKRYVRGPLGVRGRNSDNRLIERELGWRPSAPLREGLARTYPWVRAMAQKSARPAPVTA
jgi:GDP-D-mannose 3', 5'-epimerase